MLEEKVRDFESEIIPRLNKVHLDFISVISPYFGISEKIQPCKIDYSEDGFYAGRFDHVTKIITIRKEYNKKTMNDVCEKKPAEFERFIGIKELTCAHESAHYLHSLVKPHLFNNGKRLAGDSLLEIVAIMNSIVFFDLKGRFHEINLKDEATSKDDEWHKDCYDFYSKHIKGRPYLEKETCRLLSQANNLEHLRSLWWGLANIAFQWERKEEGVKTNES